MSRTCKKLSENLRYEAIDPPDVILIRCGSVEELAIGWSGCCAVISAEMCLLSPSDSARRVCPLRLVVIAW
jgi:hypothetical protein